MEGDSGASLPEHHIKNWAEDSQQRAVKQSASRRKPEKMVTWKPKEKRLLNMEKSQSCLFIKNSSHMRTEKRPIDFSSLEVTDHLSKSRGGGQGILPSEQD